MDAPVVREVQVDNLQGIHARPSHAIVSLVSRYDAEVFLVCDGRRADARSILSVMSLGAAHGARLRIEGRGKQAQAAVEALSELFAARFQEE